MTLQCRDTNELFSGPSVPISLKTKASPFAPDPAAQILKLDSPGSEARELSSRCDQPVRTTVFLTPAQVNWHWMAVLVSCYRSTRHIAHRPYIQYG